MTEDTALKSGLEIKPVTRRTLTSDVAAQLVSLILDGYWSPGQRLPSERDLCIRMKVGRSSLREALKALEIMGLIEVRIGDGTFVKERWNLFAQPIIWAISSGPEKVAQLVEARRLLEVRLAGYAAERKSAEDLREIGQALDAMEAVRTNTDLFLQHDLGFHLAIAKAAHNDLLSQIMEMIRHLLKQWIRETVKQEGVADLALEQHRNIFVAIAKGDAENAQAAMAKHLDEMAAVLMGRLGPVKEK